MEMRLMDHFKNIGAKRVEEPFRPRDNQVVLQSITDLSRLLVMDIVTHQMEVVLNDSFSNTDGWYDKGIRGYMMLFAREGSLYFGFNDRLLILDDSHALNYKKQSILRSFSITRGNDVLFSHMYISIMLPIHRIVSNIDDPEAFDEEEFDFLLWVHNVVNDDERRKMLFIKEELAS